MELLFMEPRVPVPLRALAGCPGPAQATVSTHLLAVRAGEVVRCCLQMVLQGFWGGVFIDTLHTPGCGKKGHSL